MPKISDRDKLAELVERQKRVGDEIAETRARVRGRYSQMVADLPVEGLSEREFRDVLTLAAQAGGDMAVGALKALTAPSPKRAAGGSSSRAAPPAPPQQDQP